MRPRFSEAAAEDLREARAFILRRFGAQTRKGFNAQLRRTLTLLREHPLAGKSVGKTAREHVVDGYPYSLIYSVETDEVMISALYHHSRDPSFWHDRFDRDR